jgi:prepilin-type N-terminal cleavage/methylation domain-containing protein
MAAASRIDERGFSLIELIIATGILGSALITVASLLAMSTDVILAARQRTTAAALASARLEELLSDADALRAGVESSDEVNDAGGVEPRASGWFRREWSVRASAAFPDRLVIATVRVTTPAAARLHLEDVRLITVVERPR